MSINKCIAHISLIIAIIMVSLLCGCSLKTENEVTEENNMADDIKIETVTTDSFSMNYFRFGKGPETFVIIPGLSVQSVMGSADFVAEAYDSMTDDFTIYVFDRRNELPAAYSVYDMAHDTAEAMQKLGLSQVDVFGASQGGMIAMDIAIEYPDLVKKMVLGSTSARIDELQFGKIEEWINLAHEGKAQDLYLSFGEAIYPQEIFEQSRDLLIDTAKTVTREEMDRFIVIAEGMRDFDITDNLDDISCPVLIIGSSDDQVLGAEASKQIAEHLSGHIDFELYMYDGYGHAAYDTAPDYKERISQFLLMN